jgi:hypothetical protein
LEVPAVSRAAVPAPLLDTVPALAVQPPTVTWELSGLLQVQLMMEDVPV